MKTISVLLLTSMLNLVNKDLKNILYIKYMKMKRKFKVGDRVVINPKYRNRYNCITTVGKVSKVDFNGTRCIYIVKFEGKRFEKYFYSYELELAPEEKIETQKKEDALKNKPLMKVFSSSHDEVEKPLFNVGDKVFLTSQTIEWLKYYDHSHIINPADYYKPFEITHSLTLPYDGVERVCYVLNKKQEIFFLSGDLVSAPSEYIHTHQETTQTNDDSKTLDRLKKSWILICNVYLKEFCRRHNFRYEEDMWISSNPGTIVNVCDMFISMDDIRYDVDNQIDPDMFQKWYWKSIEVSELTNGAQSYLNYQSFCEGAPDPFTEEYMEQLRKAHQHVLEANEALRLEIETFKNNKKLF